MKHLLCGACDGRRRAATEALRAFVVEVDTARFYEAMAKGPRPVGGFTAAELESAAADTYASALGYLMARVRLERAS